MKRNVHTLVFALTTFVLLGVGACGADDPAEVIQEKLVETIEIKGFRTVSDEDRAGTNYLYFVGPVGTDLFTAASASHWDPKPPPTGWPNNDRFWEMVVRSDVYVELSGQRSRCGNTVSRHRTVTPVATIGLTKTEIDDIAGGRLMYVEVAVTCGAIE